MMNDTKSLFSINGTTIIIIIVLVIIVALLIYSIYYGNDCENVIENYNLDDGKNNIQVTLIDDPRMFYSLDSTDGKIGRDHNGDYVEGNDILEYGFGRTRDQKGFNELSTYPLTYAAGHPYYNSNSFGYLVGGSWKNYVNQVAIPLENFIGNLTIDQTKDKVLLIESINDGQNGLAPIQISKSCQFKGIVVRHSGILFIQDNDIDIRTEFILVESGGLLQAGSHFTDSNNVKYRFTNKLRIILTNPPEGYNFMGTVCSQYSYMIYAPGVTHTNDSDKMMTSYMGDPMTAFCNYFAAKCIAVGFNGNYQLCGLLGNALPYKGTWGAQNLDDGTDYINETSLMTYFNGDNTTERANANIANVEVEYPNVWCRLAEGNYLKGTNQIKIDKKDTANNCLNEWRPGYQIVITCRTEKYTSTQDWLGMVPIWVDNKDEFNYNQNLNDNTKFINDWSSKGVKKDTGVEVATILSIDPEEGTILLEKPLQFNHYSTKIILDRSNVSNLRPAKIKIDTNLHVALLTRNILITSEFSDQKEQTPGCNIWKVRPKYPSPYGSKPAYKPSARQTPSRPPQTPSSPPYIPPSPPQTPPSPPQTPPSPPQTPPTPPYIPPSPPQTPPSPPQTPPSPPYMPPSPPQTPPSQIPTSTPGVIEFKNCRDPGPSFYNAWDRSTGCLTKKWPNYFPAACTSVPRLLQNPKRGDFSPCTRNFGTCQWYCDGKNNCPNNGIYTYTGNDRCTNDQTIERFDSLSDLSSTDLSSSNSSSDSLIENFGSTTQNDWNGPGGVIYCNYMSTTRKDPSVDIYDACYKPRLTNENIDSKYCGNEKPSPPTNGHWMFGTAHLEGCNSIFGGNQMFMYGSSVRLDGVEMKYMGTPANFGSIGKYPVHFHLSGFAKSFKSYLPTNSIDGTVKTNDINDVIYCRESEVRNCSIWCSFSRWITVHGAQEVNIKNNVGFVSFGSGYFIEDGTEVNNTFEHNAAICCLTASKHEYWNPLPIYPNVSSDVAPTSAYWFKNNQNRCFRNLACNSPSPVIAVWAVPQNIARLRGPSTVCIGDEILQLPGLAAYNNAFGNQNIGLSQYSNNNRNGRILSFSPVNGRKTACWVPDYFYKMKTIANNERCMTYADVNCENPYKLWSENIVYCMFAGMSEFPEAIGIPLGDYYGCGPFGTTNSVNIGASPQKPVPQFFPANGQNTCTDDWFTQCTYFGTQWAGSNGSVYPFQPITRNDLDNINNSKDKSVTIAGLQKANTIPKIFSNWLTLNLAPNAGTLWGGAGWVKSSPGWLISCCLLADGAGTHVTNPNNASNGRCSSSAGAFDPNTSSVWSMTCGDAVNSYPNAYFVVYDLISNGGIGLPPNPTIVGGNKTFFDNKAVLMAIEYNVKFTNKNNGSMTNNGSVQDYYFIDVDPLDLTNNKFWTDPYKNHYWNKSFDPMMREFNFMRLYNINKNTLREVRGSNGTGTISQIKSYDFSKNNYINKYPYVCNRNNTLFKVSESAMPEYGPSNPDWFDIVINSQTGHFLNNYAMQLGNKLCYVLSKIPSCQKPLQPLAREKSMC